MQYDEYCIYSVVDVTSSCSLSYSMGLVHHLMSGGSTIIRAGSFDALRSL